MGIEKENVRDRGFVCVCEVTEKQTKSWFRNLVVFKILNVGGGVVLTESPLKTSYQSLLGVESFRITRKNQNFMFIFISEPIKETILWPHLSFNVCIISTQNYREW